MSLKSNFVESFVKGVGKTSGIFAVLGVFAGAWYAGQYFFSAFRKNDVVQKGNTVSQADDESDILMMRELHHALNEPMGPPQTQTEDSDIKKMLDRYF